MDAIKEIAVCFALAVLALILVIAVDTDPADFLGGMTVGDIVATFKGDTP